LEARPGNIRFGKPRGGGGRAIDRAYAYEVTGGAEKATYVNGVEFEGVRNGVVLDAKRSRSVGSFYDISGADKFTQNVKIPSMVKQALRQLNGIRGTGLKGIEWHISNSTVAQQVKLLFEQRGININVVFTPKK
jgi:hypothetical protein